MVTFSTRRLLELGSPGLSRGNARTRQNYSNAYSIIALCTTNSLQNVTFYISLYHLSIPISYQSIN